MPLKNKKDNTLKEAIKASASIVFGYIPTSMIFGFLLVAAGYPFWLAPIMSIIIYAGAGQYLAVELFASGANLLNIAITTFLINSKHLFYGLSLIEEYNEYKKLKPYMIFSLTDETYAVLTSDLPENVEPKRFRFLVSIINQSSWVIGSLIGSFFGMLLGMDSLNIKGLDFAMTGLFIVIIVDKFKTHKNKLPFIIGVGSGIFALFFGQSNVLLIGTILSLILLILFRKKIDTDVTG